MGIDLFAHDLDVCVVGELSLFYIIYVCVPRRTSSASVSRKVRNRVIVIGDSFFYDVYHGV